MISQYLDKNNLHHAYLIEGARDGIVPEIIKFLKSLDVKTTGNPDFCHISIDNFKIDEAFDLRVMSSNKSFSPGKKIFIICVNSFSLDAQNVLLKIFEEPIENTHFFLVVPDANALLKTLVSRFYLIKPQTELGDELKEAEKFIAMPLRNRLDFIKELLAEPEEAPTSEGVGVPAFDESQNVGKDSSRSKALKFLNALEFALHEKLSSPQKNSSGVTPPSAWTLTDKNFSASYFEHLFKVREFLRMPGSSTKSLMESVALIVPDFSN